MPLHSPLWEVVEPYLVSARLYGITDPTYGRYTLPHHSPHLSLINNTNVSHSFRRIFLKPYSQFPSLQEAYDSTDIIYSEDIELTEDEIKTGVDRGGRWIFYSVWEMKEEPVGGWAEGGRGRGRDLSLVHGLSDYGLRYAPHVEYFLKAGFRVIIPDIPSYGRSTGVNSYLPSLLLLPAALHCVLTDVVSRDTKTGRKQQQVFLSGASMGGWTVLYYLLKYPPHSDSEATTFGVSNDTPHPPKRRGIEIDNSARVPEHGIPRINVAGAFVLCPMVEVSKASRPSILVEYIARGIKYFAGPLPLAKAVRGNVSDDPRVEEDFFADPLCYHGYLRVGTGLSLLEGMIELDKRAEEIDIPIRLVHGSADRATSYLATGRLFDRLPHKDKQLKIYEGYEHVMLKVGIDDADDAKRQRVLEDWRGWLIARC